MANFTYTVRDATGTLHKGVLEADDPNIARARLRQQGYFITSLQPVRDRRASIPWFLGRGVSLDDLMTFTFQLAALTHAGITLVRSLEALHDEIDNPMLKKIIADVRQDIQAGKRFSQALEKHPAAFSPFYVGLVRSGEVSGTLDDALSHLAELLDRDADLRAKWRGMLVYPAIVLSLAAIVITVFLLYVVPAFEKVYRAGGAVLPAPTLVLVGLSHILRRHYVLIIVTLVAAVWVAGQRGIWLRFRPWLDDVTVRLPLLGRVARLVVLSRFARTLGTMLKSGVPIIGALDATADAMDWRAMRAATESLQEEISRGRRLREAMSKNALFPPMLLQVVGVGEESGTLDEMLIRAAELLDRQIDAAVKRLLTLMEPALTLVLGAVVGVILIALYMPIFGLARAVLK
ncbi:MAG TPA: type II secretion system F family protein [bacterium]|nr:type II secretion system F family protein [bacterium]